MSKLKDTMRFRPIGPTPPCYGCEERYFKCHVHCKGYADWKSETDKLKEESNERKNADKVVNGFLSDRSERYPRYYSDRWRMKNGK